MTQNTAIEWCDHTASPWHGCTKVAAGCDHCYAERMAKRNPSVLGVWGPEGVRVKSKSFERNVRRWNAEAAAAGKIVSVFPSICDPFEDRPELVPWREEMFVLIDECPHVTFLLLTKRPENVPIMWNPNVTVATIPEFPRLSNYWMTRRPNVWIGTSVATQADADRNVPHLMKCRGLSPVLFLSAEPLLGAVDLTKIPFAADVECDATTGEYRQWCDGGIDHPAAEQIFPGPKLDWVIVGGESGPSSRPMHPAWVRSLRDQCVSAGVPFFFKQWGEFHPSHYYDYYSEDRPLFFMKENGEHSWAAGDISDGVLTNWSTNFEQTDVPIERVGKKAAGRQLDLREWNEVPTGYSPA